MTPPAADATAIDDQHPWLGLASFSEETLAYFYGREDEVAELARRVQRKLLTVLFGQSGLGKTSILRAGIVPRLRPQGYCPVYVRIDYGRDSPSPAEQIKQAIFRETLSSGHWSQSGVAVEGESLWEFLHHRDDALRDAAGGALTPLLIFDQFEEIFTLAQSDDLGRQRAAQFIDELADLVENRPPKAVEAQLDSDDSAIERFDFARSDYRILIALREDYLAHLEGLKGAMPSITQNRMRLARMTGAQALDAVMKPGGKLVSQEVAEAIVRFVAGGAELRNAEVEPSLLSLICRELNAARIAQGRSEISTDLLAGTHASILTEFYQRALSDQPAGVHRFIEEALLTDGGFRENIAQERVSKAFAEAGAAPDTLARLVDRRLLRIEERLDVRRVELTHDVLCSVVRASRDLRHEREALEAAEKQLAAQREREAATRRALVHARRVAAGCIVLAIFAVGAAGFGVWNMQRAQATREMAETACGESERLIVYLLDDFQRELVPVGRLDLVGELTKRAIDYYQALPTELRTPETERNRALAQVRYGAVLSSLGKRAEARQMVDTAVPTLDGLHTQGDASEATAIGLALGLMTRSSLVDNLGLDNSAMAPAERAVAVVEGRAKAAGASAALRRTYAAALTQLGFLQQRQAQNDAAVASLESARTMYRSIDQLQTDHAAIANFAITTAWLMDAFNALGRVDEANRAGAEARSAASQLLERHPTHMGALRARALVTGNLARVADNEMQPGRRLALADDAARDWIMLLGLDPSNIGTRSNLAFARLSAAGALWNLARPRDALGRLQDSRYLDEAAASSSAVARRLSNQYYFASIHAAELGQAAAADKYMADGQRHFERWQRDVPPGTFDYAVHGMLWAIAPVELARLLGDPVRALAATKGLDEKLLQMQPSNDYQRQQVAEQVRRLHFALGTAELEAGDFAAALKHFNRVGEARKLLPTLALIERREAADDAALLAIALAHAGRTDEARARADPALALQRELHARQTDDQWHKYSLALALVAAAQSSPAQRSTLLAEAQAALDSLPAEARGLHSSKMVQRLIADARRP